MKKIKKSKLQKHLAIFLSTCVFSGVGFYFGNTVQAAPVFGAGTGLGSVVAGENNLASGMGSNAFGYTNIANGNYTSAFGANNTASGLDSSAFCYSNKSYGEYSVALGINNTVSTNSQFGSAVGSENTLSGTATDSNAFGHKNTVAGQYSNAFGIGNEVYGNSSTAVGNNNNITIGAPGSYALGGLAKITYGYSVALGYESEATGHHSLSGHNMFGKWAGTSDGLGVVSVGKAGMTRQIQNVGAGAVHSTSTDAINGSQLYYLEQSAVKFDVSNGNINYNNITLGGIGGTIITNVKAGALNAASTEAVNGSQLYAVQQEAAKHTTVSKKAGDNNIVVAKTTNADGSDNYEIALGNDLNIANSITAGSGATKVTINGATGTIGGLTNKTWNGTTYTSGQAATEDQLKVVSDTAAAAAAAAAKHNTVSNTDGNISINSTTNASGGIDYELGLGDDLEIAGSVNVGNGNVVIDGDNSTISTGDIVIDGTNNSITVDQITIDGAAGTIGGLTNTDWDPDNYVSGQAATEDQLKAISDEMADIADLAAAHNTVSNTDGNITITETTNADDGIDYELALADELQIGSDVKIDGNAGAIDLGSGNIMLDGANSTISTGNIMLDGSSDTITAGSVSIDGAAGTIGGLTNTTWDADNITSGQAATEDQLKTVSNSAVKYDTDSNGNVDNSKITLGGNGGTTITNVAPGEVSSTSTDAVNGSQLYAVQQDISSINKDISKLGDEIDSVGALSAAMAGLHPRFQDGNKGEFAMAVGGYGGKSAVAMGGFYAPNEKVMFSLGLGVSEGGRKMGNFGVNFALDRARDRTKEPRDILYSRKEVDAALAAQNEQIQILLQEIELLKVKAE